MTKNEIYEQIAQNVVRIGNTQLVVSENGVNTYDVGVFVTINSEGVIERKTQAICVTNEETENEEAWFKSKIVKNYSPQEEKKESYQLILDEIKKMKANGEIESFEFLEKVDGIGAIGFLKYTNEPEKKKKLAIVSDQSVTLVDAA